MKLHHKIILFLIPIALVLVYFFWPARQSPEIPTRVSMHGDIEKTEGTAVATFAGGCFWCTESDFEKTKGVIDAVSGFTGGDTENPSYQAVAGGKTTHREAVEVYYDPTVVSYDQLLDVFWRHIDPTDDGGQFADRGFQYTTAIYYRNNEERTLALDSKRALEASGKLDAPIVTEILPASVFYEAEAYHQNYAKNNAIQYGLYRSGSGRDAYIKKTWRDELQKAQKLELEKPLRNVRVDASCDSYTCYEPLSEQELREKLSSLQYYVTQQDGTERPFDNEYWDNKEEGIYVDIVSGEPLFSSKDKYVSGTGWPSFVKPISDEYVMTNADFKLIFPRTEVRSKLANSHLGHVFNDGPPDRGGKRWCMNSAAMEFVPKDEMEGRNYGKFLKLFE